MFDIERFKKAQDNGHSYETAILELKAGQKRSHWIWYIFPQIKGLGHSCYSNMYGISSLLETKAYLEDDILCNRLYECCRAVLSNSGKDINEIMGALDALKLRSSMTLFDLVRPNDIFDEVLARFYSGSRCQMTSEITSDERKSYSEPTAIKRFRHVKLEDRLFFDPHSVETCEISQMARSTILLDCVRHGYSMEKMVERYLWDNDMHAETLDNIVKSLNDSLVCFSNSRMVQGTLRVAVRNTIEMIKTTDALKMAQAFDKFVNESMRQPALNEAIDQYIKSY